MLCILIFLLMWCFIWFSIVFSAVNKNTEPPFWFPTVRIFPPTTTRTSPPPPRWKQIHTEGHILKGGRGQLAKSQPWVYLWIGHFGLGEAGRPGIKNINSSKCYKIHFLPTVQPIPCLMGGGDGATDVSGRQGLGERGAAP